MSATIAVFDLLNPIGIDEIDSAGLLKRYDSKYQLPAHRLFQIIDRIKNNYYILEIDGNRIQQYKTIYYDTPADSFYTAHHNGQFSRIKIRKREYVGSGLAFLEIKKKNNKRKTSKTRIRIEKLQTELQPGEVKFISEQAGINGRVNELGITSSNTFKRITLVSKAFDERCTIDLDLTFNSDTKKLETGDLAVVELKQSSPNQKSPFAVQLRKSKVFRQGFSKYCIGRALLETSVKYNMFKPKIIQLKKRYGGIVISDLRETPVNPVG